MIALLSWVSGVEPGRIVAALHDMTADMSFLRLHVAMGSVVAITFGMVMLAVAFS